MTKSGTIPLSEIERIEIYQNTKRYNETELASVAKETGGDIIFNGTIFSWTSYKPLMPCKAGGTALCDPGYTIWGIAWDGPETFHETIVPCTAANYISCTNLIIQGQKKANPNYQTDMGGKRARTVIGVKEGRFAYFVSETGYTPEELRDLLYSYGWSCAIMLDGGGSTCFRDKDGSGFFCDRSRAVQHFVVVHLKKGETDTKEKSTGAAGLALIKQFEGCRLTAYKPVSTEQYWTIGWGHYGSDVKQGQAITQAQADAMLVQDLKKFEAYVNNKAYCPITAQLTQNQFDALVSFTYNCGPGCLKTLCASRTAAQISGKIPAYNLSGGKVLAGLTRRRAAEQALFNAVDGTAYRVTAPSGLKLRAVAVTGNVLVTMPTGAKISVLGISNGWAQVTYDGKTGYCSAAWITKV